jgi:hypothetical protein
MYQKINDKKFRTMLEGCETTYAINKRLKKEYEEYIVKEQNISALIYPYKFKLGIDFAPFWFTDWVEEYHEVVEIKNNNVLIGYSQKWESKRGYKKERCYFVHDEIYLSDLYVQLPKMEGR